MKIFLDLDGVLVNAMLGAHLYHQREYDYVKKYPYPLGEWNVPMGESRRFWDSIPEDTWATMPWMVDGKDILALAEHFAGGQENVCLLTTPTYNTSCVTGKVRWIKENLPQYYRRFMISPCKEFAACSKAVLIDDADENVKTFAENGGYYILVPRKWNSNHSQDGLALEYLESQLSILFEEKAGQ